MRTLTDSCCPPLPGESIERSREDKRNEGEDSFDFYRGTKKGGRYAARRIGTVSMLNSEARGTRCTRDVSKVETKVSLGSEETLLPFELARRE